MSDRDSTSTPGGPGETPPDPRPDSRPDPRDAFFDTEAVTTDINRKTSTGALVTLGAAGLKFVMQFGSLAVIARLLPPAEYGLFALAAPVLMISIALSNFGLVQALVQRKHVTHRLANTLFWINAGLGTLLGLIMAGLGPLAAYAYDEPRVAPVFAGLAVAVVISALSSQYIGLLRRNLRVAEIERTDIISNLFGIVLAIGSLLLGASYWALVLQQVGAGALRLVMLVRTTGWKPSGPGSCDFREARSALNFGGQVAGVNLLNRVSNAMGPVIGGIYFSEAMVGLFYRAQTLSEIPLMRFLNPLSNTSVPALSRLQDDPDALRAMFIRLVDRAGMVILPIGTLLMLAADLVVAILLGPQWTGAGPLLVWLGLRVLYGPGERGCWWALVASGQTRGLRTYGLALCVLRIAALIIGAQFGLVAMAAAFALSEAVLAFGIISALALRDTPLTLATLATAYLWPLARAFGVLALGYGLRSVLPEMSILAETAVVLGYLGVAFGLLTALNPAQRGDLVRLVKRVRAVLP